MKQKRDWQIGSIGHLTAHFAGRLTAPAGIFAAKLTSTFSYYQPDPLSCTPLRLLLNSQMTRFKAPGLYPSLRGPFTAISLWFQFVFS